MKVMFQVCIFFLFTAMSISSFARYQGFNSGSICNGYQTVFGVVDILTANQTYKSTSGMYVRVKGYSGATYGGVFYYRVNTDAAYKQMTILALTSLLTKLEVNICYSGNEVYAIELRSDSVKA